MELDGSSSVNGKMRLKEMLTGKWVKYMADIKPVLHIRNALDFLSVSFVRSDGSARHQPKWNQLDPQIRKHCML